MNVLRFSIISALLFLAFPAQAGQTWTGQVVEVIDGDTITVERTGGERVRIRLWGVDCHERRNPRADEATRFTRAVAQGRAVKVVVKSADSYGRTVAEVWLTGLGRSLNHEIIWFGWGSWSRRYAPKAKAYQRAEAAAKAAGRGVW